MEWIWSLPKWTFNAPPTLGKSEWTFHAPHPLPEWTFYMPHPPENATPLGGGVGTESPHPMTHRGTTPQQIRRHFFRTSILSALARRKCEIAPVHNSSPVANFERTAQKTSSPRSCTAMPSLFLSSLDCEAKLLDGR